MMGSSLPIALTAYQEVPFNYTHSFGAVRTQNVTVVSRVPTEHGICLCGLVLLIAVGARPVSSHRAGLGALEAARLLQWRKAARECPLLLTARAWLCRRARLLPQGWWRRHLLRKHNVSALSRMQKSG